MDIIQGNENNNIKLEIIAGWRLGEFLLEYSAAVDAGAQLQQDPGLEGALGILAEFSTVIHHTENTFAAENLLHKSS